VRPLVRDDNRQKREQLAILSCDGPLRNSFLLSTSLRVTARAGEALERLCNAKHPVAGASCSGEARYRIFGRSPNSA
jgi:hypothetical protein